MFRVVGEAGRDCTGVTRRSFVQAGLLGLGGLGLPDLFRLQASTPRAGALARDTAVILFWLSGGPGHMETWDPKPAAPVEYRGPLGAIRTSVPGVQFSELLPRQAALMDRLAVLRTVNHGSGDHTKSNHWMLTGFEGPAFNAPDFKHQKRPTLGAAVARVRGANAAGLPPYVAVPHLRGGTDNFFHYAAYLGGGANPFVVESDPNLATFRVRNVHMPAGLTFGRLGDRRQLLAAVDRVLIVAAGNDGLFGRLCQALGRPEWTADARFATNDARTQNVEALREALESVLRTAPAERWLAVLEAAGVPCSLVNTVADAVEHPQVQARNMIVTAGGLRMAGNPIKFSDFPDPPERRAAPELDADGERIRGEFRPEA